MLKSLEKLKLSMLNMLQKLSIQTANHANNRYAEHAKGAKTTYARYANKHANTKCANLNTQQLNGFTQSMQTLNIQMLKLIMLKPK